MTVARFIQEGATIDYTPGSAVAAGDVVVLGDLIGIAKRPIDANAIGSLSVEGVFDVPKATGVGTAIAVGAIVYWDVADSEAKEDSETGANKLLGKVIAAAGDDDAKVRVRLSQ